MGEDVLFNAPDVVHAGKKGRIVISTRTVDWMPSEGDGKRVNIADILKQQASRFRIRVRCRG